MKKLAIIAVVLAVLAAGAGLYLHFTKSRDFTPLVKQKLQQLVQEGSGGLYRLELDSMEIDVLQSSVVLHDARLLPDSAQLQLLEQQQRAPEDVFRLTVAQLRLDGISPADLIDKKNISLNTLHIKEPIVEIFHQKRNHAPAKDSVTLYRKISRQLESLRLNDLLLDHVHFSYYDKDRGNQAFRLPDLSCHFTGIQLDSSTQYDTTRFLFAKEAKILLNHYEQITRDNLYRLRIDSLSLAATEKNLYLFGVSLKPVGKKENFSQKLRFRKDRYDLQADAVTIKQIDWWHLLTNQRLQADSILVTGGDMEIFSDKRLPASGESKHGSFPHQKIAAAQLPVYIKCLQVKDINIAYKEFNVVSGRTGNVQFSHASGLVTNITNIPARIQANNWMQIKAGALFMNTGKLEALFRFNLLKAKDGIFTVSASLGPMDARALNDATIPLALYNVKEGRVKQFSLQLQGNNTTGRAHTSLRYDNLHVTVLKTNDEGKIQSKGLASFIANNFILESSSPGKGREPIEQQVSYTKTPQQSFWALIWKTILEGIKPSIKGDRK
jgi:hypothetical protein